MDQEKAPQTENSAIEKLPGGVKLSWGLVKQPQRGPKRELSIAQIVETAVNLADAEGLAAVSMGRVASELGFTAMSLYRYIPSKGDLLLLMQDSVSNIAIPPVEEEMDWRDSMRDFVRSSMNVFREHPWFGDIPITSSPVTPNLLRIVDWGLRCMRNFALNDYEKMSIVVLLSSFARSSGIIQRDVDRVKAAGSGQEQNGDPDYGSALKMLVTEDRYPDLYPVLVSGAYTEENQEFDSAASDFEFGLERILDGVECYLDEKSR
ncbi:TetR family transcriptional regulator [Fontibacillus phaseoli]|uniref:TetR family transcriptional regulator n=1 Tax=Fontibacillus phaseoli TaxID=1416533 RepID=A0A369BP90_9BACL|nr:TetR/AcrR family transcriptional regulator [Fontibacillus phaseoli]RCX23432.1 TetR family transcriptional regulator [Fontibacillus phaseoli]